MKNSVQKFTSKIIQFCFKNVRRSLVALFVIAATISVAAYSSGSIAGSLGELIFGSSSASALKTNKAIEDPSGSPSSQALQDGSLTTPRKGHTATPIGEGRILIVGGDAGTFEIFDARTNSSIGFGNLNAARANHTATRLSDGRVLITGGNANGQALASTEIYDKGVFLAGPDLNAARSGHSATVLDDGRILIVGGDAEGSVEILDAAARSSEMVKTQLIAPRSFHSAALLKSGDLLIVGGSSADGNPVQTGEILNLKTMTFSPVGGSLHSARISPVLRELPDGKVQIIGGNDEGSMEIFTPDGNYFSAFAHVIPGRNAKESSALKQSGEKAQGNNTGTSKQESEVLRTATRAALINNGEANDSLLNRSDYALVNLPESNKVIVFGGKNSEGEILRDTMNFDGSEATITTDRLDYPPDSTVIVSGTGFEPFETVQLTLVRDPVFPDNPRGIVFFATADENGDFVNAEYKTTDDDLNTSFVLTALGLTSERTAQTTFTDAIKTWTGTVSTDWATAGNWSSSGAPNSGDDAIIPTSPTGGQFPVISASGATARDLTIQPSATVTMQAGGTLDINRNLANSGTFTATDGTVTFVGSGSGSAAFPSAGSYQFFNVVVNSAVNPRFNQNSASITVKGDWTNNGGTSSVTSATFSGTTQAIGGTSASTFTTLTIANGSTTTGNTNPSVTTFNVNNGGKYIHNVVAALPGSTRVFGATSTIEFQNNSNNTCPVSANYGNLTLNISSYTAAVGCGGNLSSIAGDFEVKNTNGQELRLVTTQTTAHNVGGNLIISGGTLVFASGASGAGTPVVTVTGNTTISSGILDLGTSSGTPTLTINGSFTQSGGTLRRNGAGTSTMNVKGGWTRSGGTFTNTGIAVVLNGSSSQNINGPTVTTFGDITFNNGSGFTLNIDVSVNGALTLTSGIIDGATNTKKITIGSSGSASTGSSTAHVSGKLERVYSAIGSKNFPIGKGGNYRPLSLNYTALTGASTVTAEQFESGFPGTAPGGTAQLGTRYWNVTQTGGSAFTYNITLDGTGTSPTGAVKILKHDSGTTLAFATTVPNYTATGLTSLSDFTLAEDTCVAPLISGNPTSQTKNVGEGVTFSVTATGTATLTYQWRKNTVNISGATSSSYNIPSVVTGDAGSYDVVVTNGCGSATSTAATLTVNKLNQTITFGALANKTFGDPDFGVSATATSSLTVTFAASGNCTVTGTTVHITGAGSCTITASQAGDATYNAAPDVMQSFNIAKATPTITWANPADITYGTALSATQLNASGSVAGGFVYTPASGTVLNAGNGQNLHTDFTPTDTANYNNASKDVSINVLKKTLTITADNKAITYGDSDPAFTFQSSGFVNGDLAGVIDTAPTCGVAGAHANAGGYSIVCSGGADNNYDFSYVNGTLTVNKANAVCTITGYSVTYDGAPHTATGSCLGVASETLAGLDLSGTTHTGAGSYPNDPWTFTDSTGNYNDTNGTVNNSIAKVALTITASSHSVTYGDAAPTVTASYGGFIAGEDSTDLTTQPTCSTTYTQGSPVSGSPYPTSCSGATAVNYEISYTNGTVTVSKANAVCTITGYSVTYDGNPHTATGSCLGVASETLAGLDLSGTTHTGAGSYPNDPWTFTDVTGNYNDTNGTVNDTISKANANCSITGYSVTYDGAPHTATGSCLGVASETLAGLDLSGTTHTNAGTYNNDPWTFTDSTGNYNDTNGTVNDTISKANAVCTITGYSVTYDGNPHTATGSCLGVASETLAGLDLSGTTHTGAGTYNNDPWTFTDSTGNYNDTAGTVNDSISKANAVCTITGYSVTYDGNPHTATGSCLGVASETLAGLDLSSTTHTSAGSYPNDPWTFTDVTGNYNDTNGSVADSIAKVALTITASSHTVTYGDAVPTVTASYGGFIAGEDSTDLTAQPSCSTTYTQGSPVSGSPYPTSCSGAAADNYEISYTNGSVTVNKKGLTVTASSHAVTYGDAAPTITASYSGFFGSEDSTDLTTQPICSTTYTQGSTVGGSPYPASCSGATSDNYDIGYVSGTVTVSKANAVCTITGYGVTYDGAPHTATGSCLGVASETLTGLDLTGTTHTNAGTYNNDPWTFTDVTGNYNDTNGTVNDSIAKAAVTATAGSGSATYDGSPKSPSDCAVTGAYTGNLTCANSPASVGPGAGTTVISPVVSGDGQDNFEIASVNGSYTIHKADAVCTITGYSVTYDAQAHTATGSCTGVGGDGVLSGLDLSGTTHTNAGGYVDSWTFTDVTGNYNNQGSPVSDTIGKAALTITASSHTLTYGDAAPTISPSYGGFVLGENSSNLTSQPVCSTTYTSSSPVSGSPYPTNCSGAAADNYEIGYTNGTVTVNTKSASVTANSAGKTYGDTVVFAGTEFTTSGFVNGDGVGSVTLTSSGAAAAASVGSYDIVPSSAVGTGLSNYSIGYNNGTLTVNARAATVTANNKNKTYGDDNPALDATVTGTVNGDVLNYTLATTAVKFSSVGGYPITVTLGSNPNYDVTPTNGTLTITAKTASVTANNKNKTYGDDNPALDATVTGTVNGDMLNYSLATTAVKFSSVGDYPITVTLGSNPNYDVTPTNGTLSISAKSATVSADHKTKTYGDDNPGLTATVGGTVNGDTLNYTLATTALKFSAVGDYPITVTLGSNPNYDVTPADNTLTINRKSASVTANNKNKTYGDVNPSLDATVTGTVNGDVLNYSLATTALQFSSIGDYPITVTLGSNPNYDVTPTNGTLSITVKPASVTANSTSKTYGDTVTFAGTEFTTSGFVNGDSVASVTLTSAGAASTATVGPYNIVPSAAVGSGLGNYNIAYNNGTFTVDAKDLTVTADNRNKVYGSTMTTGAGQTQFTTSGLVNGNTVTSVTLSSTGAAAAAAVGAYDVVPSAAVGTGLSNYDIIYVNGTLNVTKATLTVTADNNSRYYGQANPAFTASYSGFKNGQNLATSGVTGAPSLTTTATGPLGSAVGGYTITAAIGTLASNNYDFSFVNGTLTINPDPTAITLDATTSGTNFDCTTNTYTATLKDTVTNQGLSGVVLKLSIGTQGTTATTNASGVATFAIVLNQPPSPPTVTEKAEVDPGFTWSSYDTNRTTPASVMRSFTILADPYVGPGINAASLYTGSLYFWTTSSTSSTATLTLSATLRDTFPLCPGDITKAKVTFQISTNGGSSWSNVSSAQNLPVGLVNPNDTSVGTASAISQYNIGSDQSVTLMVRVVVGGNYIYNSSAYDLPITIGKPGLTNSLMGGGKLNNDGSPFFANGYFGLNSINSAFGSQVQYNKKGVNPQGQVTVTVLSCNNRLGVYEAGCSISTPNLWHKYFIKSNSISELSLISGSASFGSKTNVSEVLADGSKISLDGGNTMQLIFTPQGQAIPQGFFTNVNAPYITSSGICNNVGGCASIVIFRSSGGVWYSSSWGQAPGGSAPRTYVKNVVNGSVFVQ